MEQIDPPSGNDPGRDRRLGKNVISRGYFLFYQIFIRMRKLLLLLPLFTANSFLLVAQTPDEKAIRDILTSQTVAWNKFDMDDFMKGYWNNDSLVFVGKNGVTYGYQNALNNYKKHYGDAEKMGKLSFDILQIKKLSDEYYSVLGKWFLKRKAGDLSGHYTLLFKKLNGSWVIVSDHSS